MSKVSTRKPKKTWLKNPNAAVDSRGFMVPPPDRLDMRMNNMRLTKKDQDES